MNLPVQLEVNTLENNNAATGPDALALKRLCDIFYSHTVSTVSGFS